ncbi:MAG TPA: histidine kinase N-terminal 7TM domain-containing protein [Steroidobacteraceae bacterium]
MAALGIKDGDQLVLDHPWDDLRQPVAGETFRFTKLSPGPVTQLAVSLPTNAPPPRAIYFAIGLSDAAQLLVLLSGLFILWRSRSTAANTALGMAFVCFGAGFPSLPMSSAAFLYWALATWPIFTMGPALFLRFAMDYDGRNAEERNPWNLRLFYVFVIAQALAWGFEVYGTLKNYTFPLVNVKVISYSLEMIGCLWPCYFLARGWMRSRPSERKRYAVMLIALSLAFLPYVIVLLLSLSFGITFPVDSPFYMVACAGKICGALLFAYAVLRHKILDLGFAINRALVYGTVSALVLIASGLLEWVSEHFIHLEGRDKNVLLDAAFALAVFLTFHRVWSFVENHVESLFFHQWHSNEATLKRFVKEAAFITKAQALSGSFVSELSRFSGGARCSLYLLKDHGAYQRAEGTLIGAPETIDADDPALVTVRANRAPVELEETRSALSAVLVLPMMHRDELQGVVLLGTKPSGEGYRPDEIELLGASTQQIGLDLHALGVTQLEQELSALRQSNATLLAVRSSDLIALQSALGDAAGAT